MHMRKALIFSFLLLILTACEKEVVHEDIRKDYKQIEEIADKYHKSGEEPSEEDIDLYRDFHRKYVIGQFEQEDGEVYEMNDLEKEIIRESTNMWSYVLVKEEGKTLASEKDEYTKSKDKIKDYLSSNEIPEDLEDEYPTYELVDSTPEVFEKDKTKLFNLLEPIVNGDETTVTEVEYVPLVDFTEKYSGEGFEHKGKHYFIDGGMQIFVDLFNELKQEIDDGNISAETIEDFNFWK